MVNVPLIFLAFCLYFVAGVWLAQQLVRGVAPTGTTRRAILASGITAVVLHAVWLYTSLKLDGGLNLALTGMVSLVAWAVAALFAITVLSRPMDNLGIVIFPIAGLTILVAWLWPGAPIVRGPSYGVLARLHIINSVLAYSLICIAAVQSLMLLYQERMLHARHPGALLRALPPLQTMERFMFQMLGVGFVLLTATLVSGVFFSEQVFGKPFKLTHHIVLSVIGWSVFAVLLAGRRLYGWRGQTAARFTLAGFLLLLLGYFGSKFVLEVLLSRTV
jgi:ABC-type uncharacterized transport system permease subunit